MDLERVAWLVVSGAVLGLAARFFLAPNSRVHTAIIAGVVAVVVGPWVLENLRDPTSRWFIIPLGIVAAAILVGVRLIRAAEERRRREEFRRRAAGTGR
jgi:uncharacterized membrane protein YeaQ/YmgE (transglycosylase-associated protein family)